MITDLKVDRYYKIVIHNNCGWGEHYEKDDDWSISGIGSSIVEAIDNAFRDYYSDHHDIESLSKICALDIGNIEFEYMSGITFLGVTYYSGNLSGIDRDDFNSAILDYATIAQCNFHDACMKNVSARKICGELAIENVPLYGMRLSGTKWHASSATYGEKQVTGYHQTKASIDNGTAFIEAIVVSLDEEFFRITECVNGEWSDSRDYNDFKNALANESLELTQIALKEAERKARTKSYVYKNAVKIGSSSLSTLLRIG